MIRTCICGTTFAPSSSWQWECDECERRYDERQASRLEAEEAARAEQDWNEHGYHDDEEPIELEEAA
jgi:hypothetical protein